MRKSPLPASVESALNTVVSAVVAGSPQMAKPLRNLPPDGEHYSREQQAAISACAGVAGEIHRITGDSNFECVGSLFSQLLNL